MDVGSNTVLCPSTRAPGIPGMSRKASQAIQTSERSAFTFGLLGEMGSSAAQTAGRVSPSPAHVCAHPAASPGGENAPFRSCGRGRAVRFAFVFPQAEFPVSKGSASNTNTKFSLCLGRGEGKFASRWTELCGRGGSLLLRGCSCPVRRRTEIPAYFCLQPEAEPFYL